MDSNNPMKKNIKKIVYVMFENRSFDNVLGWLYDGIPNPDVNNIPANADIPFYGLTPELKNIFAQPIEYRIERWNNGKKPIVRGVENNHFPTCTPIIDPEETFSNITQQLYGNAPVSASTPPSMDGFLQNYYESRAGYVNTELEILDTYDNAQLPILNTLAKSYGVSDEWFCSIPSQTSINRAFSICGNSVGLPEKNATKTMAMVNNHYWNHEFLPAQFTGKTIWQVLSENGYHTEGDWKVYYSCPYLHGTFGYKHSYSWYMFQGLQEQLAKPESKNQYQNIGQFYEDAKAGNLPRFSYIEPKYSMDLVGDLGIAGNDYHPPGSVAEGEQFLKQLYEAVSQSPDWEETLFIVAWDEHGGTFDHMPPPHTAINPGGADEYECGFEFDRFGVRVPMLFISPWVTENTVIRSDNPTIPFDHTSWLATLLDWFDLEPSLLGKRTAVAPTFDAVISDQKRDTVTLPGVWKGRSRATLTAEQGETVDVQKAASLAHAMALQSPNETAAELLEHSLENAKTQADIVRFYKSKTLL